uniref:Zinc finger piccolo-type domain-containing protein n=2 Tax=Latimeria chalumnae TaxID=7897 RepID=H3BA42_LATCH
RKPELDPNHQPKQAGKPPDPGPSGISKSQTVDAFKPEKQLPGRSPSSISLRENRSRTELKEEPKPTMMPSFLTEGNPLSAVSSVVNKFSPFDLKSEGDAPPEEVQKGAPKPVEGKGGFQQQPAKTTAQQQSSSKPSQQQQKPVKPTTMQTGPTSPALQQQNQPTKSMPQQPGTVKQMPQQPSPAKSFPQQSSPAKPTSHQAGPGKPVPQQAGPGKPVPQQAGPKKPVPQQPGSQKTIVQQPGSPKTMPQQPGSPKTMPQQSGSPKLMSQQLAPKKPTPQQPGTVVPTTGKDKSHPPSSMTKKEDSSQYVVPSKTPVPKKTMCPICTTTELLFHTPENVNYNTCTQCQTVVCSLCGFNPNPHMTEVNEWLCLNCQMQRALNMNVTSSSVPQPIQPKQPKAPELSPQKDKLASQALPTQQPGLKKEVAEKTEQPKPPEPKKPPQLIKQQSMSWSPPMKTKQAPSGPQTQQTSQQTALTQKHEQAKSQQVEEKLKQPDVQKPTEQTLSTSPASGPKLALSGPQSPATAQQKEPQQAKALQESQKDKQVQHDPKFQTQSLQQKIDSTKPDPQPSLLPLDAKVQRQTETVREPPKQMKEVPKDVPRSVDPKTDTKPMQKGSQTSVGPKPGLTQVSAQPQQAQKSREQPRRFSLNLGSMTETPKHQPITPQESSVTGKLFGFGASIFSQASSFMSTTSQPGAQAQGQPMTTAKQPPPSQPPATQASSKEVTSAQQLPKLAPAKSEAKLPVVEKPEQPGGGIRLSAKSTEAEKKPVPAKEIKPQMDEPKHSAKLLEPEKPAVTKPSCPLCKTELNVNSKDPPNYNTCTECKNLVCNLCGFNPAPHLVE